MSEKSTAVKQSTPVNCTVTSQRIDLTSNIGEIFKQYIITGTQSKKSEGKITDVHLTIRLNDRYHELEFSMDGVTSAGGVNLHSPVDIPKSDYEKNPAYASLRAKVHDAITSLYKD